MVNMDAKLLHHILENLLSNAMKYSPPDSPVIFTLSSSPETVTFRIEDHGIGIPQEDQARLFEAFHRAKNTRKIPGTGLGLAIVKQAVELHNGTITCETTENVGTTFTVVLPVN
jgi:signal transduction histidine kinase